MTCDNGAIHGRSSEDPTSHRSTGHRRRTAVNSTHCLRSTRHPPAGSDLAYAFTNRIRTTSTAYQSIIDDLKHHLTISRIVLNSQDQPQRIDQPGSNLKAAPSSILIPVDQSY